MTDPVARSLANAPFEDEPITPDEAAALDAEEADEGVGCRPGACPTRKTKPQSWLAPISLTRLATNDFASPNSISVLSM